MNHLKKYVSWLRWLVDLMVQRGKYQQKAVFAKNMLKNCQLN
jgi:hypothetical protein